MIQNETLEPENEDHRMFAAEDASGDVSRLRRQYLMMLDEKLATLIAGGVWFNAPAIAVIADEIRLVAELPFREYVDTEGAGA